MKVKSDQNYVTVFTDSGEEIKFIQSLEYKASVGDTARLNLSVASLSDLELTCLDKYCKITIDAPTVAHYPSQILIKELERRGYKLEQID